MAAAGETSLRAARAVHPGAGIVKLEHWIMLSVTEVIESIK
jgi:hypothetical protein